MTIEREIWKTCKAVDTAILKKTASIFTEDEQSLLFGVDEKWLSIIHDVLRQAAFADHDTGGVSAEHERTNTGTIREFGVNCITLDMMNGFPLLRIKHVSFKQVVGEMLWMMKGLTNINDLKALGGGNIWDAWADDKGNLGPIYGTQWRNFGGDYSIPGVDQLANVYEQLIETPFTRRACVSAWNPLNLPKGSMTPKENAREGLMALPPCHHFFQFSVSEMKDDQAAMRWNALNPSDQVDLAIVRDKPPGQPIVSNLRLDLKFNMRSSDLFIGLPYNLAGYALMLHLYAKCLGYQPGKLHYTAGDAHIYTNHFDAIRDMCDNIIHQTISQEKVRLVLSPDEATHFPWDYQPNMIKVESYKSYGRFAAPVAV